MKIVSKSLIAICMLSAVPVSSASEGFYVGLNVGQANYDASIDRFAFLDDDSIYSVNLEDKSASYSITLGYQLNPYFSLEGGYIDLGKLSVYAKSNGSGLSYAEGSVDLVVDVDGLFLDVKGQLPLNEYFSLYGKLGLLEWDAEATLSDLTGDLSSNSADDNDTFFGIGVSFNSINNTTLNVDYTMYKLDDEDIDVLSLGLQFGF